MQWGGQSPRRTGSGAYNPLSHHLLFETLEVLGKRRTFFIFFYILYIFIGNWGVVSEPLCVGACDFPIISPIAKHIG